MNKINHLPDDENYIITHVGDGNFTVKLSRGEVKNAGKNLNGMIRYTYFEDFTLPPIGWTTTRYELLEKYYPKVMKDVLDGKITKNNTESDRII